jgi:hypothetical protein
MYEDQDGTRPGPAGGGRGIDNPRLRWGLLAAVVVVLIAAIPGIALNSGSDTKKVTSDQAAAPSTTSTTVGEGVVAGVQMAPLPAATTTTVAGTVTPLQASTTLPPATTTTAALPPAPPPTCHNSYDPACGPFRWDPDPGPNAPLTVTITPPSQQVKANQPVNFHVMGHDPDAKIQRDCVFFDFGDGQTGGGCPPPPTCQTPYGPWTPPAKVDDTYEFQVTHTYTTARSEPYQVSVVLQSHSFCNPDPYGGSGQAPAQVTVGP